MWRRTEPGTPSPSATPSGPPPRDSEALEHVLAALDAGVHDEVDSFRTLTGALAEALELSYGAVWLPEGGGSFRLSGESGPLAAALGAAWRGPRVVGAKDGLAGQALTRRAPVVTEDGGAQSCQRWSTARTAGARHGAWVPIVRGSSVVALQEFYADFPLPFTGPRGEKWQSLLRVAEHSRRGAVAAAQLKEAIADRVAVTEVVKALGRAQDTSSAVRAALDTVRASFGWAYGSYWALDEAGHALRFDVESGSAGEEFRRVTLSASPGAPGGPATWCSCPTWPRSPTACGHRPRSGRA
jgi:hypothetical protein